MEHEKTGEWPDRHQQRWAPLYEKAVFWQAPRVWRFDPLTGPIAELDILDKAHLIIAQLFAMEGNMDGLEVVQQAKGWSDEDLDRMLPELGLRKWKQRQAEKADQEPQGLNN